MRYQNNQNNQVMKTGDKVKYIGKGFLGFNPLNTEMIIITESPPFDYYVEYNGKVMLVSKHEIIK